MKETEINFEGISASFDVGIAKKYGINCAVLLNKLMYLSKYTSRQDGYCWKTAMELENELGLTRKQQKLAINKLEEEGILKTKNTYITGTQTKCKHFKLLFDTDLYKRDKSDLYKRDKSEMYERDKSVNNNKTVIIKHSNNIYIVEQVIKHLNEITNSNYKSTTRTTRDKIIARLNEGFTLDDFIVVIDKKYWDWKGTEFEQYMRPETLFGTKFESYLNQPMKKKTTKDIKLDDKFYEEMMRA